MNALSPEEVIVLQMALSAQIQDIEYGLKNVRIN